MHEFSYFCFYIGQIALNSKGVSLLMWKYGGHGPCV